MKTSNIILISFFSVIGLFLLSLTIQREPRKIETECKSVSLPQFRHLVVNSNCNLSLLVGLNDSLSWQNQKNTNPDQPSLSSRGDTLFLNWHVVKDAPIVVAIFCKELESVTVNESTLNLTQLNATRFQINGSQCKVNMLGYLSVDSISINLKGGSNLQCSNTIIKSANIKLENSEAWLNMPLNELIANISQNSNLYANQVLQANVIKDASSKYYAQ